MSQPITGSLLLRAWCIDPAGRSLSSSRIAARRYEAAFRGEFHACSRDQPWRCRSSVDLPRLACGKYKQIRNRLAWMNFFIIYVALPCLFTRARANAARATSTNVPFIIGTTLGTASAFALSFAVGWAYRRKMAEATIAGLSGALRQYRLYGAGLALATLGLR